MSDETGRLREAWWGGDRGQRPDIVHLVEWPTGRTAGYALCRKRIHDRKVFDVGSAAAARVAVCTSCQRALESRRHPASVRTIGSQRRRGFTA